CSAWDSGPFTHFF
nr:immunoglobulin light chain junction region [Macaca mulatta]